MAKPQFCGLLTQKLYEKQPDSSIEIAPQKGRGWQSCLLAMKKTGTSFRGMKQSLYYSFHHHFPVLIIMEEADKPAELAVNLIVPLFSVD